MMRRQDAMNIMYQMNLYTLERDSGSLMIKTGFVADNFMLGGTCSARNPTYLSRKLF